MKNGDTKISVEEKKKKKIFPFDKTRPKLELWLHVLNVEKSDRTGPVDWPF